MKIVEEIEQLVEKANEVRYINPDNVKNYDPNDIEKVKDAQGNDRYKRKDGSGTADKTDKPTVKKTDFEAPDEAFCPTLAKGNCLNTEKQFIRSQDKEEQIQMFKDSLNSGKTFSIYSKGDLGGVYHVIGTNDDGTVHVDSYLAEEGSNKFKKIEPGSDYAEDLDIGLEGTSIDDLDDTLSDAYAGADDGAKLTVSIDQKVFNKDAGNLPSGAELRKLVDSTNVRDAVHGIAKNLTYGQEEKELTNIAKDLGNDERAEDILTHILLNMQNSRLNDMIYRMGDKKRHIVGVPATGRADSNLRQATAQKILKAAHK